MPDIRRAGKGGMMEDDDDDGPTVLTVILVLLIIPWVIYGIGAYYVWVLKIFMGMF